MSALGYVFRQFRYENKAFWRNPASAFFTFIFPLMFLVIFNGIFDQTQFYVPAIAAFSIITACFTNLVITLTMSRDEGILKRLRGTPLPSAAYLGARVLLSLVISLILVAVIVVAGALLYDVAPPFDNLPRFLLTLGVGAASFCALGLAFASIVPNGDAAPPMANAAILPLSFVSDIFVPATEAPEWMQRIADIFPIKHFSQAMLASFNPDCNPEHPLCRVWSNTDLIVVAVWGLAGALVAARFFTWEPRK